jgi:hypothetical protein
MRKIIALAPVALVLAMAGCNGAGNSDDNGNARDVRLAELRQIYVCHVGARAAHQDLGAIVEPKGVNSAAKLGRVTYQQAVALADKFDVIQWCQK